MKLNYLNRELFIWKFKREPKDWTLDEIHDLWVRARERYNIRQKDITDYIGQIVSEIPKNESNEHIVYFQNGDRLCQYTFRYNDLFKSFGYSQDISPSKTRDDKLNLILSNGKAFEMGQHFRFLTRMSTNQHYKVERILEELLNDRLRKIFKDKRPPKTFLIEISNRQYFVESDLTNGFGFLSFKLSNQNKNEIICLS